MGILERQKYFPQSPTTMPTPTGFDRLLRAPATEPLPKITLHPSDSTQTTTWSDDTTTTNDSQFSSTPQMSTSRSQHKDRMKEKVVQLERGIVSLFAALGRTRRHLDVVTSRSSRSELVSNSPRPVKLVASFSLPALVFDNVETNEDQTPRGAQEICLVDEARLIVEELNRLKAMAAKS
eukprot:c14587_g1_i1.p2 GENE.c14587_g1_i1~~c14587_g1_i1.p2  ORF type:complete len:179 (+),score=18.23 c14587_g1_i1:1-537(+)